MNKRGQVIFYVFMLGIVLFVLALALTPVVKIFVDDSRNTTTETRLGMDCDNSSISNFQQAQCLIVDFTLPYFLIALLGLAAVVFGARVLFGGVTQ